MQPRTPARLFALGRVGFGTALLVAPVAAAGPWIGSLSRRPGAKVALAGLGARDVAIGLGSAWAIGGGTGAKPWLLAGALSDAADLAATMRHRDALPGFGVVSVGILAAGSSLLGTWLAYATD